MLRLRAGLGGSEGRGCGFTTASAGTRRAPAGTARGELENRWGRKPPRGSNLRPSGNLRSTQGQGGPVTQPEQVGVNQAVAFGQDDNRVGLADPCNLMQQPTSYSVHISRGINSRNAVVRQWRHLSKQALVVSEKTRIGSSSNASAPCRALSQAAESKPSSSTRGIISGASRRRQPGDFTRLHSGGFHLWPPRAGCEIAVGGWSRLAHTGLHLKMKKSARSARS
jgi:hypothetical protein